MIVQIRGTSGSGKTWLIYRLMEHFNAQPILKEDEKIEGYLLDHNIRVAGRYTTACGGMDTIRDKEESEAIIRRYADLGHVFFEGLLISGVWGRWYQIAQDYPGQYLWLFMDTPLEKCNEQVMIRNGGKPVSMDNLRGKYNAVQGAYKKAVAAGEKAIWIDHTRPWEHLLEILDEHLFKNSEIPSNLKEVSTSPTEPSSELIRGSQALQLF